MSSVADRSVIVLGAGGGIGRATAVAFGAAQAHVIAADIDGASAQACASQIQALGGSALAVTCDATSERDLSKMVRVAAGLAPIHSLICSAGVLLIKSASTAEDSDWLNVFSANVVTAELPTRYVAEQMKTTGGGSVVVVASICGHRPDSGFATYSASKAALLMLVRSMAVEYASWNIRVNAVSPGPVETPALHRIITAAGGDWCAWKQSVTRLQIVQAMAQPADVANAVTFLCSEKARMITGVSLPVDGGLLAKSALNS
jgi:NAD(P)-dependent dehydrogenase (short-subunit alcohol dehydrogenase family)